MTAVLTSRSGKTARSKKEFERASRVLVGGVDSPVRAFSAVGGTPLFFKSGSGSRVTDLDGNRYLDYCGSWGPLILGHAPAAVLAAVKKTLVSGTSFGAPTVAETELGERIQKALPSIERLRFVSSGTEAVMSAIRLARGFTGCPKIIKFQGCYHGHSDGLLIKAGSGALTHGVPDSAGVPQEVIAHTVVLPYNDTAKLDETFEEIGPLIAAVIVEPVAANMGVVLPTPEFLKKLRDITQRHKCLLIFDEVVTGFRLGRGGAQSHFGITPDLTCLGKIIGGGFPVGAYGGRREIMEKLSPLGPVYQAGTLSGNPVAMSAGIATLDRLTPGLYQSLEKRTAKLTEGLAALAKKAGVAVQINSIGSLFTVFFASSRVWNYGSAIMADTKQYAAFFHAMLEEGVYLPPAQFEAAFVSAAHTDSDIAQTLKAAEKAFKKMKRSS